MHHPRARARWWAGYTRPELDSVGGASVVEMGRVLFEWWSAIRERFGRGWTASPADHCDLGLAGERIAERYLRRAGMRVVARRFRTPAGELDLVMRDGSELVFVEVKTQRSADVAPPQDRVGRVKQRPVVRAARWFARSRGLERVAMRFDVVAVLWPQDGEPDVMHIRGAFEA